MQSIKFLKDLDELKTTEEAVAFAQDIPAEVIQMASHYLVKELVPIPVDLISQKKIKKAAKGESEKERELLVLYLGTSLLGHQVTGQFAGLSFAASERELYAASLVVKTFYNLESPDGPHPETGRLFYRTRTSLWEKLLAVITQRGLEVRKDSF